eukprot:TRINITY_DN2911_c0_g1_i1.p3 TRINITY_DN2911_c0_g1~~TRINITY_DN2911_c0_g1_i1.p3  ORF type:complete len:100 (-),score=9.29 TRINITY_DN2911_c0_g1_i1:59-358(-)
MGTVLRKCLCVLLQRRHFSPNRGYSRGERPVTFETLEKDYPRYPTIQEITIANDDRQSWLDIRPYISTAPYVIDGTCIQLHYGGKIIDVATLLHFTCVK